MQPLHTSPSASSTTSRGTDYQGFLRVNVEPRVSRVDVPRVQFEKQEARNRRLDRSTEGVDADFVATRGSTTRPIKRMVWSPRLKEHVWWVRRPDGKWEPTGCRERAVVRKLRVELSDAHGGQSVEEILDALSADDFEAIAREVDPNAHL